MKKFNISVSKCDACPWFEPYSKICVGHCTKAGRDYNATVMYAENKDGITPSCPMWSEAVEVSE